MRKKKRFKILRRKIFRGFTLIEMLVVTAILGALVATTLTGINIDNTTKNAHDSVRKSDLNTLHKALVQFLVDNRCLPTELEWQNFTCDGPVPDFLAPYLTKIPCDPETHEKYYYEPMDASCKQCNGGCGVCVGFRLLTHLKLQKDKSGKEVGCNENKGCGVFAPDGTEYNYGIMMAGSCTIPTPTLGPPTTSEMPTSTPIFGSSGPTGIINSVYPTPTHIPSSTPQPPTPTLTVTPSPAPTNTPIVQNIYNGTCQGIQLTPNGSFEINDDGDRIPDYWRLQYATPVWRENEGIYCSDAFDGRCSWYMGTWGTTRADRYNTDVPQIWQMISKSGPAGDTYKMSLEIKMLQSSQFTIGYNYFLRIIHPDGTLDGLGKMVMPLVANTWVHGEVMVTTTKPYFRIDPYIDESSLFSQPILIDNVCITKVN